MTCFSPLQAYRSSKLTKLGKRGIVFSEVDALNSEVLSLPCGQCIGCRLERSRQWAIRCMHEASLHRDNCFITLTFSSDFLPHDRSLRKFHFQRFMKRLRKRFGNGIRYYYCGEYGEKFGRPHYHACLFGFDFADKYLWKLSNGIPLFRSNSLEELWPYGYSSIGSVTFESAAYVARYIMKKVNGPSAISHYEYVDSNSGEVFNRVPEFTDMSRGRKKSGTGGIGKGWFDKYSSDVYPHDFVVLRGKKVRPPKYYDRLYEVDFPDSFDDIKHRRVVEASRFSADQTDARLADREFIQRSKLNLLVRSLDKEV